MAENELDERALDGLAGGTSLREAAGSGSGLKRVKGPTELAAKATTELKGLGTAFDGTAQVEGVTHEITTGGHDPGSDRDP